MRRVAAAALAVLLALPAVAAQDPNPDVDTWTDARWDLTFEEIDVIAVQGLLHVHESRFEGSVRTADDIRDLHDDAQAAGEGTEFRDDAESTVASRAESTLESLVQDGDAVVHDVNVVNATLEDESGTDGYHPPVDFEINATLDVVLDPDGPDDETRQKLRDALRMGATMPLDLDLSAPAGRNRSFSLHLPDYVRTTRDLGTPIEVDIDNWKGTTEETQSVPLTVTGADATVFRKQQGEVRVRIDLHDLGVDVLSGSGSVQADIQAVAEVGAIEVPAATRQQLPDRVRLNALGADGLRFAVEEGYVSEETLEDARKRFGDRARAAIQQAFGPDAETTVRFDRSTIEGGIQGGNDDQPPVRLVAEAQAERTFGTSGGGQALVVTTLDQRFAVSAFEPFATAYTIVLPSGLTAEDVRLTGNGTASQTSADGREAVQVDMAGDAGESEVAMTVGVTLLGLLAASPLLLGILLLILLLVVLFIIWVVVRRRDRRERKQAAREREAAEEADETPEEGGEDSEDGDTPDDSDDASEETDGSG